jgi:hypothetical protein
MTQSNMQYSVDIFKTKICGKCQATMSMMEKVFDKDDFHIHIMNPDTGDNMEFANKMKERGLTQSPFVFIKDESGEVVDSWNNFQIEKIKKWVNKLS